MILGIDIGSTTTKIVLMDGIKVVEKYRIENYESYEDILDKIDLTKVTKIMTVGAGASFIEGDIRGIKTEYVEEFKAVALGGYFLSGLDECMVVSLGTGTSLMYVNKDVPTVFYAQAFCAKCQLAKYLADKYNGLYIDIDDFATNSVKAKIEAFLRLR